LLITVIVDFEYIKQLTLPFRTVISGQRI